MSKQGHHQPRCYPKATLLSRQLVYCKKCKGKKPEHVKTTETKLTRVYLYWCSLWWLQFRTSLYTYNRYSNTIHTTVLFWATLFSSIWFGLILFCQVVVATWRINIRGGGVGEILRWTSILPKGGGVWSRNTTKCKFINIRREQNIVSGGDKLQPSYNLVTSLLTSNKNILKGCKTWRPLLLDSLLDLWKLKDRLVPSTKISVLSSTFDLFSWANYTLPFQGRVSTCIASLSTFHISCIFN